MADLLGRVPYRATKLLRYYVTTLLRYYVTTLLRYYVTLLADLLGRIPQLSH